MHGLIVKVSQQHLTDIQIPQDSAINIWADDMDTAEVISSMETCYTYILHHKSSQSPVPFR